MSKRLELKMLWTKHDILRRKFQMERELEERWSRLVLKIGGGILIVLCIEIALFI